MLQQLNCFVGHSFPSQHGNETVTYARLLAAYWAASKEYWNLLIDTHLYTWRFMVIPFERQVEV